MSLKTSLSESALNRLADTLLNYLNKDPEKNLPKALDKFKIVSPAECSPGKTMIRCVKPQGPG